MQFYTEESDEESEREEEEEEKKKKAFHFKVKEEEREDEPSDSGLIIKEKKDTNEKVDEKEEKRVEKRPREPEEVEIEPKPKRFKKREKTVFIEKHVLEAMPEELPKERVPYSTGDPLEIDLIEPEKIFQSSFDVPGLPRPPISQIVNAQSKSGKTNYLINLLQENRYGKYFQKVYVFSETCKHDPKWAHFLTSVPDPEKFEFYDGFGPEEKGEFNRLYEEMREEVEKDGQADENARLFIMDDVAGELFNRGGKPTVVQHAFMRLRHINGSIIVTSQEYMMLPKTVRVNTNHLILFEMNNRKERKTVATEHGNGLSEREFNDLTNQVWKDRYSFLFIDYGQPIGTRFRKNLNMVMIHPDNDSFNDPEPVP